MRHPPLWLQARVGDDEINYDLGLDREILLGAAFSRPGVLDLNANQLRVTQRSSSANMSVDIAAGRCVIEGGDEFSGPGMYLCTSTSTFNLPLSAPGSGTRVYVVYAQVRDKREAVLTTPDESEWIVAATYDSSNPSQPPTSIPDAIELARVTVSSGASSIVNANIVDRRHRTSTGSSAITGTWGETGIASAYGVNDSSRPLTWLKNRDGWVTLSGWFVRQHASTNLTAGTFYSWDGNISNPTPCLPLEIRPTGPRDTVALSSNGYYHLVIHPQGHMTWRFSFNTTLVAGGSFPSWFTFDGIMYRARQY